LRFFASALFQPRFSNPDACADADICRPPTLLVTPITAFNRVYTVVGTAKHHWRPEQKHDHKAYPLMESPVTTVKSDHLLLHVIKSSNIDIIVF